MQAIKTFEDACKKLNVDPTALPDFSILPEKHRKALLAHTKLVLIAEALNDGWKPNWEDSSELKYYPWFDMRAAPSGSGLSFDGDGRTYTFSDVGSRLCYQTDDIAAYAGEQFLDLYADYFLIAE